MAEKFAGFLGKSWSTAPGKAGLKLGRPRTRGLCAGRVWGRSGTCSRESGRWGGGGVQAAARAQGNREQPGALLRPTFPALTTRQPQPRPPCLHHGLDPPSRQKAGASGHSRGQKEKRKSEHCDDYDLLSGQISSNDFYSGREYASFFLF